jgi:glucokinase
VEITTPDKVVASIVATAYQALENAGKRIRQVSAMGLCIPGQVDAQTGVVNLAVNLNLYDYPLREAITAEFGIPCVLENDARAATIGAYHFVQRQEMVRDIAFINIGTGVGAGVMINGRLHRGANGMAGEIGHMVVEPGGSRCNCGARGCLETVIGGRYIIQQATAAGLASGKEASFTAYDVYRASQEGHLAAQAIVRRVGEYLGRAIQWLILTYDVEKVILGGGVTSIGEAFWQPLNQTLLHLREESSLGVLFSAEKVVLLPAGYNAGLWGVVCLAQEAVKDGWTAVGVPATSAD